MAQTVTSPVGRPESIGFLTFPKEAQAKLSTALQSVCSPYLSWEQHCIAAQTAILSHFPPSVISAIRDFHERSSAPGALVITGLPQDCTLPPTPSKGERSTDKHTFVSEACLAGVGHILGSLFGYATEKQGEIIHNVCPVPQGETTQSNESSRVELSLHVENAYFNLRPDYLLLYCLRQDHKKEASTSVVDIRCIVSEMDPDDVVQLQEPVFIVPSPVSHHCAMNGEKWSTARPLFETPENPNFVCSFPGMKALTPLGQKALDNFEVVARRVDVLQHVRLEPGTLLLINNRKIAHGRTCFEPKYDGQDRWLQRVYVRAAEPNMTAKETGLH
ncbi:hypothetical protein F4803DRAFT_503463 [Xylaria telfairii]|nr:hypothetical protein F4803DRAFT_503463 [Xylaria telfairii]